MSGRFLLIVLHVILFPITISPARIRGMPTAEFPLTITLPTFPLNLICHPATPAPVVRAVDAQASWQADGSLLIAYCLWGDMARLRVPEATASGPVDLLWEHTCFEAFIGIPGQCAYREYNFSPSGQWAAYDFSGYRQRDADFALAAEPRITMHAFAGRLELQATLSPDALPSPASGLEIGLSAVIEAADMVDGAHSYWALHHPVERPDFHHRAAFTLTLAAPTQTP